MKPVPTSEPVVTACGGNATIAVRTEFGVGCAPRQSSRFVCPGSRLEETLLRRNRASEATGQGSPRAPEVSSVR